KKYGSDIGVAVEVQAPKQDEAPNIIEKLNNDKSAHGIIVQLPLEDPTHTDKIVNLVAPNKDVDALGSRSKFEPATPMAIMWLLSGYNVDLAGKKILLIGRGKLVGAPLEKILRASGQNVQVIDRGVKDIKQKSVAADVIIPATGNPAILPAEMIKPGAIVVD